MSSSNWPANKIVRRMVSDLVPYARNSRTHSKAQVQQIAASIREWGWTTPCLIDEENGLIAGHGRVLAAQMLGIDDIPCIVATGWTKAQKQAYVIADNKLAENAGWDKEMLKVELGELADLDFDMDLIGFDDLEMKGLLQADANFGEGYDKTIDVPTDPVAKKGQLWLLGKHRLLCGDSTSEHDVTVLLDGAKPRIMVTDPPYGVEYDPSWRKEAGVNNSERMGKVQNDDKADWTEAWKLFPGDVCYVWHAARFCAEVSNSLERAAFEVRAQLVWAKNRFALGRGNYHWQHEPCWYAVRKGKKAHWIGDRSQSTIWNIKVTDDGEKTIHGTQKPIEAMGRPMRNHDCQEVYEPFCGSGSTLIACELAVKQCFAMEIDPGYVDVIITRWQDRTGQKAVLAETGEEFDAISAAKTVAG